VSVCEGVDLATPLRGSVNFCWRGRSLLPVVALESFRTDLYSAACGRLAILEAQLPLDDDRIRDWRPLSLFSG